MKEDRLLAKLTIHNPTEEQREEVIRWLLDTVDFIKKHNEEMADKFTARIFADGKRKWSKKEGMKE